MGDRRQSFAAIMVVFGMLVVSTEMVSGKVFPVGRNDHTCHQDICWTTGVSDWPENKTIVPGDVLEFDYQAFNSDVTLVDEEGYNTCKPGKNAIVYQTGHDYIQVPEGPSYYICSLNDLCFRGMKVAIIPK